MPVSKPELLWACTTPPFAHKAQRSTPSISAARGEKKGKGKNDFMGVTSHLGLHRCDSPAKADNTNATD